MKSVLLSISLMLMASAIFAEGISSLKGIITWDANKEPDLSGYRLYTRPKNDASTPRTLMSEVSKTVNSITSIDAALSPGQHYLSLTAVDTAGNESVESARVPFVQLAPTTITGFTVTNLDPTSATITFQQDGEWSADIRMMPMPFSWGKAGHLACVGHDCTATGLSPGTTYGLQGVGYAGEMNTPTVIYSPLGPLVTFATPTVVVTPPTPEPPPIIVGNSFSVLSNKGRSLTFQYKDSECPKGVTRTTSGSTTKIVTMTCLR